MSEYKRYLVTAALPYANGPVHIGHLAGVYIPADVYVRYLRLRKKDALFVCGSDEHGVPITIKAKKEGVSPQVIVDRYHEIIKKSFQDFGILFDYYSRTSSKLHHKVSSDFFKKLNEKNVFVEKTSEQYFDVKANQFLADRYITGECPKCHQPDAYGDQCEKCGSTLSPTELINPKSAISGEKPIMKETKHWFLPLDKYEDFLKKWILEDSKHWKPNVYGQCKSWIDQGLQARAVSRDLDWGVPVPVEGASGKVLYVWFDAPIGYITSSQEVSQDWEKYWKSPDSKLVHFIGKDNIVFHCIVFPVMLKAHGEYILPENVPANEFLNLEGEKISTSKNWAVWLHEYLNDFEGQQDSLRYTLLANAPETKDNDFTWKDFQARNNNELVAILGNFINRVVVLTNKYYDAFVPDAGIFDETEKNIINETVRIKKSIEDNIENFKFREALKEAMNLARIGNKYLADSEPWKIIETNPEKVKTIINLCLNLSANLSVYIEPFLPFTSGKIKQFLNLNQLSWESTSMEGIFPSGHKINSASLLFRKIEDSEVEVQIEKLNLSKKNKIMVDDKIVPAKPPISYDEFSKMDIRTATILEAEKIPKADKLLKLKIDTGIDVRTVVSGIAQHYKPEDIIGKKVTVLVNLEPRTIRGIESKGMILMADTPDSNLYFVSTNEEVINGSVIK